MATDTATVPSQRTAPDPTRHIWQVPLFLLGVSFFVATWQDWIHLGPPDPNEVIRRDLAALRNEYESVSPDRDKLNELLRKIAGGMESLPDDQLPIAHYILGSGYTRLAELTPVVEEARGYWMLAQQHFDKVNSESLTERSDVQKLGFRAAKARAAVGLPAGTPANYIQVQIQILANTPLGEEPGEAGRLQADLAMKLLPPDFGIAKDALTRYLKETGLATPSISRDRAKILLGELHFRRKEMDLARKWLENISSDAATDLLATAKALLARVHMAEGNWLGAIREWEAVRAMPNLPPALRALSTYNLGVCKLNTRAPESAVKLFEEAAKGEDSPETAAAQFQLADLYLKSPDATKRAAAAELLVKAMKGISNAGDLRNNINVKSTDIYATFELAISTLTTDGMYEPALKVVAAYTPIVEGGREREKRAEVLAAWATALQKSKDDFKPKAIAAAKEYSAFAAFQSVVSAKADTLRRAAAMYLLAGEPALAVTTLQEATKLPGLSDAVSGAVWVDLADALLKAKRTEEVWQAFNEAMRAGDLMSTITRFNLAQHFKEIRRPECSRLACLLFEQIAKQTNVTQAEQEYQERALVELGHELIRVADFAKAELSFRQQLHTYPNGPEAPLGRLLLGVCLLQLAQVPQPAGPTAEKATALQNEALQLFKTIVSDVDLKQKRDGRITERDAWLRLQAGLRILQTLQQMKNPNELLYESADLLQRHRDTVEELIIRSLMFHAFKQKGDIARALATRDQMKELFDRLPASAFIGTSGEYSREYWEQKWFTPDKK